MATEDALAARPDPTGAPVFVDASGRRAKRIERIAAVIVLACIGYGVSLLIAALTGVPIEGAILPYPALGSTGHANRPPANPSNQPGAGVSGLVATSSPTPTPSVQATKPSASAHPVKPTATTTSKATHPSARPTAKPTPTAAHGKSTSAPGYTNRPTPTGKPTTHRRTLRL